MWILFIVLAGSSHGLTSQIEFESYEKCNKARILVKASSNYAAYRTLVCLEK